MPGSDKKHPLETFGEADYIRVEGVTKTFGPVTAVRDASMTLAKGRITGFLGSDGAGKTTLLRMLATMIRPSSGSIRLAGLDTVRHKDALKPLIGYMPQRFGLYQDLSVAENFDFFMDIFGVTGAARRQRRSEYLGFSNLLPFVDRPAGALSGGMKQKLGLACVLVHQPKVLILDEPTNGVDPISRREFWQILKRMQAEGMTILVSTAYLDEGELCDQLILLHQSHILAQGPPEAMRGAVGDLETAVIEKIAAWDKARGSDGHGG